MSHSPTRPNLTQSQSTLKTTFPDEAQIICIALKQKSTKNGHVTVIMAYIALWEEAEKKNSVPSHHPSTFVSLYFPFDTWLHQVHQGPGVNFTFHF